MKYVNVEKQNDKLYVLYFSEIDPTEEQFEEYLSEMVGIYENDADFVFIFESSKAKYLSSKLRIRQGNWIKENTEIIQQKCKGHIYLITNPIIGFILKGIFLVQKPPIPYAVVNSMNDALKKATEFNQ